MRTRLMKQTTGGLVAVALVSCPYIVSVTVAGPLQTTLTTTASTRLETNKSGSNSPAFARHTTSKGTETPVASPPKVAKKEDKKAIGRCWNRLMAMVREARQAHHSQK